MAAEIHRSQVSQKARDMGHGVRMFSTERNRNLIRALGFATEMEKALFTALKHDKNLPV
jgi:hypothetical protein